LKFHFSIHFFFLLLLLYSFAVLVMDFFSPFRRKKEPRLREMALLESEVEEFFDSAVYLRGDEKVQIHCFR
jgi:hypothetical protein